MAPRIGTRFAAAFVPAGEFTARLVLSLGTSKLATDYTLFLRSLASEASSRISTFVLERDTGTFEKSEICWTNESSSLKIHVS